MPVTRFWLLHKSIDRIHAETDHRMLMVTINSMGGDGAAKLSKRLVKTMGTIAVFDEEQLKIEEAHHERDREGLLALKAMGRMG